SVRPDFRGHMTLDAPTRCAPFCGSVTLHPSEEPAPPYSVLWKFRDDVVIGPVLNACVQSSGVHTVAARILDSASACTTTLYFPIEAFPRPTAAFTQSPDPASEYAPVVLSAVMSGEAGQNLFTWYFAESPGEKQEGPVIERNY